MTRVRYWAGARALARTAVQVIDGDTLAAVLSEVRRIHGVEMARLLDRSVVIIDGVQAAAGADQVVHPDTVIEILPPYAGGAR